MKKVFYEKETCLIIFIWAHSFSDYMYQKA